MFLRQLIALISVSNLILLGAAAGPAQQDVIDREYILKAAYLYNFGLYIDWPENALPGNKTEFVIGVLGRDPFGGVLEQLVKTQQSIRGKKIVIKRFATMKEYQPCNILFIGRNDTKGELLAAALTELNGKPVLLVSESPGHLAKGSIINLFIADNAVRFEIHLPRAKDAGLQPSSRLLKVGKVISE